MTATKTLSRPTHWLFLALALLGFAANSILSRYGLGEAKIDPASFTLIRIASGAIILGIIVLGKSARLSFSKKLMRPQKQHWLAASFLLGYAIAFSYAYISLSTATGALILFGTVQITLISYSLFLGRTLNKLEWLGFAFANSGFLYLTLPQLTTPSFTGFVLMTIAGIGWAFYTLKGQISRYPLVDTALNFLLITPACLALYLVLLLFDVKLFFTIAGVLSAIGSGALASGLGYAIWYSVLPALTTSQAATAQLLVPIIAGIGGFVFIDEAITLSLLISGGLILGGVYIVIAAKK